jgi:hypothetical protein
MRLLSQLTDRELLEQIYLLLLQINCKVNEIDSDEKQFGINLSANLFSEILNKNKQHV